MTEIEAKCELPPLVERLVQRLVHVFAPERIVLFGSWAKGQTHDRSDVDLLIIGNAPGGSAFHLNRARRLAAGCFPPVDFVFAPPSEIEATNGPKSLFLMSVIGTGFTLYSRAKFPPSQLAQIEPGTPYRSSLDE
jgi:predicted nucleotidyltransferase